MVYCALWGVYYAGVRTRQWKDRIWRSPVSVFLVLIPSASTHGLFNRLLELNRFGLAFALDLVGLAIVIALVRMLWDSSPYRIQPAGLPAADVVGYAGRTRMERVVLRTLGMRTPASTPGSELGSRYLIVSTLRTADLVPRGTRFSRGMGESRSGDQYSDTDPRRRTLLTDTIARDYPLRCGASDRGHRRRPLIAGGFHSR
jgi:hypothetical protein